MPVHQKERIPHIHIYMHIYIHICMSGNCFLFFNVGRVLIGDIVTLVPTAKLHNNGNIPNINVQKVFSIG